MQANVSHVGGTAASRLLSRLALMVAVAGAPTLAVADPAHAQEFPSDSVIRSILQARVDNGRAPGIIVGILENGERRFIAYGSAGPGRQPLDEHTVFEIGSISKTFTALLLADAVTRGQVQLDQPLSDLLPEATTVPSRDGLMITLKHLATHRSGLPRLPHNLNPRDAADPYADYDETSLRAFLADYSLPRSPGETAEYSNLGAGLLGHALASHSGSSSWGELVNERITGVLGMRETSVDVTSTMSGRLAAGHAPTMDTVPPWVFAALAGAGALRSTAGDMLTYLAAHLEPTDGPLASAIALARMPRSDFGGGNRIALGWLVRGSADRSIWWHNGGTGGFASFAAFEPHRKRAVVVLANAAVSVDDIGAHLIDPSVSLGMPAVPPRRTAVSIPIDAMERVAGEYALSPDFILRVIHEGEALYLQAARQPRVRLWPSAPERFFIREVDAELTFTLGDDGFAKSVTLLQNGVTQTAVRR